MEARAARVHRDGSAERSEHVGASDGDALRGLVQHFVRQIGLLSTDQTPCGKLLAVSHAHALMVLLEHQRARRQPTQQDLGRVLGIDKSNVARLCRKMERSGQLTQKRDARDGRLRLLALTGRGVRLAGEVERSSRERFQRLIAAVSADERASVLSAMTLLNEALATSAMPSRSDRAASGSRGGRAGIPAHAGERDGDHLARSLRDRA
jgi:DNA-binding MarR family transcriptional regulator